MISTNLNTTTMKKLFITFLIFITSLTYCYSQCTVTIMVDTIPVDTLKICLGDSIDLIAEGHCNYFMFNDFNNGTVGTGWYSNATPMFNNPCPPLLPPASGIVCWIGSATNFPRELTTVAYNLTGVGCTIEFDMKYGDLPTAVNCEDPDQPNEGVYLQYSIDGAITWHTIHYWTPTTNISGPLYTWTHYLEAIPPAAFTLFTQFRWFQDLTSGFEWDHWGIDNVEIKCASNQIVNWSTGHTVFDPPPMYPAQTTDITCYVMNTINGDFAIDSVHVIVGNPLPDAGPDTIVCFGDSAYLSASILNPASYLWNTGDVTQSIVVSPVDTVNYTVTVTDYIGCTGYDSVQVIGLPLMPAPDLRCVSVLGNGNVTLSWMPPTGPLICFDGYLVSHSYNPNGPYNIIDTISDINTLSYTHVGANGQAQSGHYFIEILTGANNTHTESSDTLSSILINVVNNANTTADIIWNPLHTPALPTSSGYYFLYREYPPGNWVFIDSTTNLMYSDTITACDFINYRVEIADSSGCISVSSIDGDEFQYSIPPELRCTAVDEFGDVTISWVKPPDAVTRNAFDAYIIYYSPDAISPFIVIDSVFDYDQTSYFHANANADVDIRYYYVETRTDCTSKFYSQPSDTLNTMLMNVVNSGFAAELTWNTIRVPDLPTSLGLYYIYREYPIGTWTLIDSTTALNYSDTIYVCDDSVFYYVEIYDASGCASVSSISGDYFWTYPPVVPVLDSVSIDNSENAILGWQISPNRSVLGYMIYHYDSGIWTKIDTVWGHGTTTYTDTASNPCSYSESYCIAAFDSCGSSSLIGFDNIHHSIYLEIEDINPCTDFITLRWNQYINLDPPLAGYNIFVSENGGPFTILGQNLTYSNFGPDTSFIHEGLNEDSRYCYFVQAFDNSEQKTSSSCIRCFTVNKPPQPKFVYLRYATIVANDHVSLMWYNDISAFVQGYRILRAESSIGPFEEIANITTSTPLTDPNLSFIDYNARFDKRSYYYKIIVVDSCGLDVLTSNVARTVFLTVIPKIDMTNRLLWNDYKEWPWSYVESYNIYRKVEGFYDLPVLIANVPYKTKRYTDDVSNYFETTGKFTYYVEALEGFGFPEFEDDMSVSNEATVIQNAMVYVPNAFAPKGYNDVFIPISIFTNKTDYTFVIYNRWGEKLFETNNPEIGWDGTFDGEYVPLGVYVYYVKFLTSQGEYFEKQGSVTVVK